MSREVNENDLHFEGAADGLLHAVAVAQQLEEFLDVGHRRVGRSAQRHDLPQEDAERPHVRLAGVNALEQGFRRHPFDRKPAVGGLAVVFVHVDVTRQSEVGDLEDAVVADQDVARRQVAVDALEMDREKTAGC